MDESTDTSVQLLRRYRAGDHDALNELLERQIQPMRQWARGRLDGFEPRHGGAVQSGLRQAVLHRIRDEVRRGRREPMHGEIGDSARSEAPSPEQEAEASELFEAYEAALSRLTEDDREAIARITGRPSEDEARIAVSRALVRRTREMGRNR